MLLLRTNHCGREHEGGRVLTLTHKNYVHEERTHLRRHARHGLAGAHKGRLGRRMQPHQCRHPAAASLWRRGRQLGRREGRREGKNLAG